MAFGWLGQGDTSGDWMDSNGVYTSGWAFCLNANSTVSAHTDTNFMWSSPTSYENVLVMPESFWSTSLLTSSSIPVRGFVFPTLNPNVINRGIS